MSNAPDVLRTAQINLKLTPEELDRLKGLAEHLSLSEQSVLRLLIKRAGDEYERHGRWPVDAPHAVPSKPSRSRK
jgi:hypothetical protein